MFFQGGGGGINLTEGEDKIKIFGGEWLKLVAEKIQIIPPLPQCPLSQEGERGSQIKG